MAAQMKITAFCPTLNRPDLLPRLIACFERQTYENRELIILDDGGQYENQQGDRWQIVSVPRRFRSLGEKNNAAMAMASFDSEAYLKADDDDIYMPWWFESMAQSLKKSQWVVPGFAMDFVNGEWVRIQTWSRKTGHHPHYAYHGCWGYRRELIEKTGGYFPRYAGDDGEYQTRLNQLGLTPVGIQDVPFYWYNRPLTGRISDRSKNLSQQQAYVDTGKSVPYVGKIKPYSGEPVWEKSLPTKCVSRGW
jgi:glycosyltransferase involved in cell wall biosynthesis